LKEGKVNSKRWGGGNLKGAPLRERNGSSVVGKIPAEFVMPGKRKRWNKLAGAASGGYRVLHSIVGNPGN